MAKSKRQELSAGAQAAQDAASYAASGQALRNLEAQGVVLPAARFAKAQVPGNHVHLPTTITKTQDGFEKHSDIISNAYNEARIVFINGAIDEVMSYYAIVQLMELDRKDPGKPIQIYINSPGGSVSAGLAIIDAMTASRSPIMTIGMGMCASMGSFILSMGDPGLRCVMPGTEILVHQPLISGGLGGQSSEINIHARHLESLRDTLEGGYMLRMGLPATGELRSKVTQLLDRDNTVNAVTALKLGLIDKILDPMSMPGADKQPVEAQGWKKAVFANQMERQERDLQKILKPRPVRDADEEADRKVAEAREQFKGVIKDILEIREKAQKEGTIIPEFFRAAAPVAANDTAAKPTGRQRPRPGGGSAPAAS